jgi:uncharacterized protein YcfJ
MNVSLLSTVGLGLLILSGIGAVAGVFLKNDKLIYASLILFLIIFAAYFIVLPRLVTQ